MTQTSFFPDMPRVARALPLLGEQKDIRYFASPSRSVLNSPAATGMGFWSINPYVGCAFGCAYCYARYAHRYTTERLTSSDGASAAAFGDELPPWLAFERRIMIKHSAPALLRSELARAGTLEALRNERMVIGTATDPYQPAERRYRITRGLLEVIAEQRGIGVTIITKSPLVTRDIDILTTIRDRSRLCVHVSLITVDRELARRLEPRAPTPEARLRAIARLRENDIEVGVNVMPVLPGITDAPHQVDALICALAQVRASYVGACALRLRATARTRYLPFIAAEFPELESTYRRAYATGHQVGERYRSGLRARFKAVCERYGVAYGYPPTVDHQLGDAMSADSQLALALEPS